MLVGAMVTLDGSGSGANGDTLTYNWDLAAPSGSTASLSSRTTPKPTFVVDLAGIYSATLVVNDGKVNSAPASVTITASVANAAPVANAGLAQNVLAGTLVTLNGSASSDANGDQLSYNWSLTSKPAGSSAVLGLASSARPTFAADLGGTYVASLTVNDGKVNSTAATVTVTAAVANVVPVANAGAAQNVVAGTWVTLDGSASSDANGDQLTYSWSLTSKPAGSSAVLGLPSSARPTFTADLGGTYVASLTVNDGKVNSAAMTVVVTALAQGISLTATNVPVSASKLIAVVDGGAGGAVRLTFPNTGNGTVSGVIGVPAGTGYRVRVIALGGSGTFPSVLAGGRQAGVTVTSGAATSVNVALTQPTFTLDPSTSSQVATGGPYSVVMDVNDPAEFLDGRTSGRFWWSTQTFTNNLAAAQSSGNLQKLGAGHYRFSINMTAPGSPGTIYYQFGESSSGAFDDPAGQQAPFLILPDLNANGPLLAIAVGP